VQLHSWDLSTSNSQPGETGWPWSIRVKSWLWCGIASRRSRRASSC